MLPTSLSQGRETGRIKTNNLKNETQGKETEKLSEVILGEPPLFPFAELLYLFVNIKWVKTHLQV